ncbi:DUF1648 domain-containing protein [Antrihabitans cavernicola]|uniref:DUF1648 domain-containing protein n=1 Tax=Antrihabitans cavernicola TaxID=2495913 RepID=A0A5A7SII3_9NOCA|nr:DUF1648 domain-containing protein [Spelaeibacter cavernicola]KAA0025002.1 DUF1648 domain-containing protein [Spelaeibacter cavernicola]
MKQRTFDPVGVLFGIGLPVVAAVVGVLVTHLWRHRLPDRLATHWSGAAPNGFSDPTTSAWTFALITLLVAGGCCAVAALAQPLLIMRRAMLLIGLTVLGLLVTLQLTILIVQLDITDSSDVRLPTWAIGVGALGGFCVGVIGAALLRDHRRKPAAPEPPAPDLPRGQRTAVLDTVGFTRTGTATFAVVALGVAALGWWFVGSFWPVVAVVPVLVVVVGVMRYRIVVDGDGIRVRNLGMTSIDVGIDEIEGARVTEVSPFKDFGGWGLRAKGRGRYGIVTRTGPAIEVRTAGALTLTITTDHAQEMAGALNSWADGRIRKAPESRIPRDPS